MNEISSTAVFVIRYTQALNIAVVVIVLGWHAAGAGPLLVAHLPDYPSDGPHVLSWAALAVIAMVASVALLRGRDTGPMVWPLAAATLAICAFVAAISPASRLLETDWAWGTTGWISVLLLLNRPVRVLVVVLGLEAAVTFAALAVRGALDRHDLAGFLTVLYASLSIQLAVSFVSRALYALGRRSGETAAEEADTRTRQLIADQIHAARQTRYAELGETLEPLLRGIADHSLAPADPAVQRTCAIEAARLRRLFAESDDVPEPLIHELRSCVDAAERHGIVVDLETAGSTPDLPPDVRRALTDAVIAALAVSRREARITVVADEEAVIVGLLSKVSTEPALPSAGDNLTVRRQRDDDVLWMEARWRLP